MSEEIEKKIRTLAGIRRDESIETYLNPFRAREHITFLLGLIDELTEALFKIHELVREERRLDPNIDPSCKHDTDALAS